MKTILNKLRFVLVLAFVAVGMTVLAQAIPNQEKMSISTLMFLDEMAGKISFDQPKPTINGPKARLILDDKPTKRPIAKPDTIDGKVYISAFIKVTSYEYIPELEALGVNVMCQLGDGLMATLIPIDMIEQVAAIDSVTLVEVGELMEEATDLARQASNVDDLLTLSQDAQLAGVQQKYDGKGVVLAIMDNGIDFQHIAFKDKDGNSRIKGAYCYNGSSVTANWTGSGTLPTTDATDTDHGTHTSSIAGGSSVIVNGTDITVTDDHANASYGGMAPGADLYLGGFYGLNNVYMAEAYQNVINYAEQQGKPLVVSNSWSTTTGARDGHLGSSMETFIQNNFGDSHPNRVCLFAASNRAGNAKNYSEGGGLYVGGTSSRTNPVGSILRYHRYSNADNGYCYNGYVFEAWGQSTTALGITIYVLDNNTGEIKTSVSYTPNGTTPVEGLSDYYSGSLTIYTGTNSITGKRQIRLLASSFETKNDTYDSANNFYYSNNTLAVEVYPTSGSCFVDMWGGTIAYFTNSLTTSGHNWIQGSDDVSTSDNAAWPNVISVGSYITRQGGSTGNEVGDISPFSGYATASACPAGVQLPWITAPGQLIVSAFNHLNTSRTSDPLINNANYPYGTAQGTSMATPAAAGIVALWMQAASECGHQLTHSEIKNIMDVTAIKDYWVTSGPNASHFGKGKIDALAGIEYILQQYAVPTIFANPTEVTFDTEPSQPKTQTVDVSSILLTGDITATLNDNTGTYSINNTNLGSGGNLVITYLPTNVGNHNATVTLTSPGANSVTITITGTCALKADTTVCDGTNTNGYLPIYGYYYEAKQVNQMIYPASMLNGIRGKRIKSMKFYSSSGINFYGGKFNVSIGTTTQTTFTSQYSRITGLTQVTTDQVAANGVTELLITFDEPFEYNNNNNLVIDFEVTEGGTYSSTYFDGVNQSSYTSFNTQGSTKNNRGVYTGTNSGRRQFLPKVTFEYEVEFDPVTAGSVTPDALTFTDVPIGRSSTQNVTVTNTGNQPFTPVIDTSNLPAVFVVTGNGEVLPNGTLNLTVTYTPTDEGPHSGSFTVTIGDQTYTITVTGNGIIINNTLISNTVMVPVYKTDIEVLTAYTMEQLENDTNHLLPENATNTDVNVKVSHSADITRYDIYHREGIKESEDNWATGEINRTVAYANVNQNTYIPFAKDEENLNNWVQQPSITFDGEEDDMWIHLNDFVTVQNTATWYVPVVVANGVVTTDNTYGAPIRPSYPGSMTASVNYDISTVRTDANNNNAQYLYMTAEVALHCEAPQVEDGANYHYECYKARAWRVWTPYVLGVGAGETIETLMGEVDITGAADDAIIGCKDFQLVNGQWSLDEPTFCIPAGTTPLFVSRFYYRRVANNANQTLNAGGGGGGGGGAGAPGDGPAPPGNHTGISNISVDKEVSSVTYVSSLGMTSNQPFEGVNIIVTRYTDGTTSTSKMIHR